MKSIIIAACLSTGFALVSSIVFVVVADLREAKRARLRKTLRSKDAITDGIINGLYDNIIE